MAKKGITLGQFAARLDRATRELPRNVTNLRKEVAGAVVETLVQVTPVKTGLARTNWRAHTQITDEVFPTPPNVQAGMDQAIITSRALIDTIQPKQPVYIINNLYYIGKLNRGWSVQAPANFVRIAVRRAAEVIAQRRGALLEFK